MPTDSVGEQEASYKLEYMVMLHMNLAIITIGVAKLYFVV